MKDTEIKLNEAKQEDTLMMRSSTNILKFLRAFVQDVFSHLPS